MGKCQEASKSKNHEFAKEIVKLRDSKENQNKFK